MRKSTLCFRTRPTQTKLLEAHTVHVRQAKFCLRVCQVVFLGGSPTDWPVSYELK